MTDFENKSVLYLTNQYPKVSHSFIRRELRAIEALGVTVHRAAFRGWEDDTLVDPLDLEERDKTYYTLQNGLVGLLTAIAMVKITSPLRFFKALAEAFRFARVSDRNTAYHMVCLGHACRLLREFRYKKIDHIHVHFATYPAEVAALMRILGGPPFSFTLHGPEEFDDIKRMNLSRKIAHADHVVAITHFCKSQIFKEIPPADWSKVQVIRCGLPASILSTPAPDFPEQLTFINIGRFSPVKGQLYLVEAFAAFLLKHPDARLILAGDGELRADVEVRLQELGIAHAVEITGWISSDAIEEKLSGSTCMIHPSFSEGLPIVMMEAMALGRPVIASSIAGHPELVKDGQNGWLIPAGSIDAIVDSLDHVASLDPAHLREMGENAKQTVSELHAIDDKAEELTKLFFS